MNKNEESIVSSLSDKIKLEDVKAVYAEVRVICDDAAKTIQRGFRLWQAKKQSSVVNEANVESSLVAGARL